MRSMKHQYPTPAGPSFIRLTDGKVFVMSGDRCLGLIIPHADPAQPKRKYRVKLAGRMRGYSGNVFLAVRWILRQGATCKSHSS